jgi:hypothetical protein
MSILYTTTRSMCFRCSFSARVVDTGAKFTAAVSFHQPVFTAGVAAIDVNPGKGMTTGSLTLEVVLELCLSSRNFGKIKQVYW